MNAISNPTAGAVLPFAFDGKPVRVVMIDGQPWFVGKDVAERLGYGDPTTAIKSHCRGVQKLHPIQDSLGRTQNVRVLTEPDVLRLVMGSTLPAAQRFERWVFEDVLPAVRRDGGYVLAGPEETPEELAARALTVLQATIERQKAQLAISEPKAAALDRIATVAEGSMCFIDTAKALQVKPKALFGYLQANRWIYRRAGSKGWVAYQDRIKSGLLECKVAEIIRSDGSEKIVEQVKVTAKGLTRLAELLSAKEAA